MQLLLCAHANSELNIRRKELIKPRLHEDYKHLCSASGPSSSQLFWNDLSKQVKDLTEVSKVGRKMTRCNNKPHMPEPQLKVINDEIAAYGQGRFSAKDR